MNGAIRGLYRDEYGRPSAIVVTTDTNGQETRVRWKSWGRGDRTWKCDRCGNTPRPTCPHATAARAVIDAELANGPRPSRHTPQPKPTSPTQTTQPEPQPEPRPEPLHRAVCRDCLTRPARDPRPTARDGRCHGCWTEAHKPRRKRSSPTPSKEAA